MERRSKEIIERIKRIRKLKKLNQDEMSNLLNMSKSSYVRLENFETELTVDCVDRIAEVLDTNFETLTDTSKYINNMDKSLILQQGNITILNLSKEDFNEILSKLDLK